MRAIFQMRKLRQENIKMGIFMSRVVAGRPSALEWMGGLRQHPVLMILRCMQEPPLPQTMGCPGEPLGDSC